MDNLEEFNKAAEDTRIAIAAYAMRLTDLLMVKYDLKRAENAILATTDPKELGSNEAQRAAQLFMRLEPLNNAVLIAAKAKEIAEGEKDAALIEWERVRIIAYAEAIPAGAEGYEAYNGGG